MSDQSESLQSTTESAGSTSELSDVDAESGNPSAPGLVWVRKDRRASLWPLVPPTVTAFVAIALIGVRLRSPDWLGIIGRETSAPGTAGHADQLGAGLIPPDTIEHLASAPQQGITLSDLEPPPDPEEPPPSGVA